MDLQIIAKGESFPVKAKDGTTITNFYLGAGWDMDGSNKVDLDLVAACLDANGKLTAQTRLVYFADKTEPGVTLSEDNRSGEGEGDDESIVFDLSKVEADVMKIAFGIIAYAGADLSSAKNVKFRGVNGSTAADPQVLEVPMTQAAAGDTVLHAGNLVRGADGWTIENVGTFYAKGNNVAAVQAFAGLFT